LFREYEKNVCFNLPAILGTSSTVGGSARGVSH
jgi:hypothetical protein